MKLVLFLVSFFIFSVSVFSQNIEVRVDSTISPIEIFQPYEQTLLCIPIVEENDSLVILKCDKIRIEIAKERFYGAITYVIIPNEKDVKVKTTFYLPMPPKEDWERK